MANFSGTVTTAAGDNLQAKAQIGQPLEFTRVALGDGAEPAEIKPLNALVNERLSLGIQSMEVLGDGTSRIRAFVTNQGLADGFYIRELGVFARDPATGDEQLYGYTHAADTPDFMPAEGGATVIEQTFDLITVIGQAQNVTAQINELLTLATKQDLDALDPRLLPDDAPQPGAMLQGAPDGSAQWVPRSDALSDTEHLAMIAGA
ncbi:MULTISPECIES: phage tail protein [Phaeobacter]|uniref:phage tail-collar fiber domain-containing protein n=1 Tax=Phaeobacter TaxID=302485 RepID=UPI003A86EBA0